MELESEEYQGGQIVPESFELFLHGLSQHF